MGEPTSFICTACAKRYPLDTFDWRCTCGGFLGLSAWPTFDAARLDTRGRGLWRYHNLLPLVPDWEPVTLGEGGTPLIPVEWERRSVHLKVEGLAPTGSFKDRGAAVLATALRGVGVQRVVEDSSGNAGASLAAYAARAGIACEIFVPGNTSGPKLAQMAAHGAEVIQIKGKREHAALAAWAAAAHGAYYASHVYSPYFLAGISTLAYELWEQLGARAPGAVLLPVGNGTLLLGLYQGFQRLLEAGLLVRPPRLIGVQAAACAPIYRAFAEGHATILPGPTAPTAATGIAISQPVRGAQILAAVHATGGTLTTVTEEEIEQTRDQLARRGFYVEETAAVGLAGLPKLLDILPEYDEGPVVALLTGHGLKRACTP